MATDHIRYDVLARDALRGGKLKKGDLVLFAAVCAGYKVGANLWRWAY